MSKDVLPGTVTAEVVKRQNLLGDAIAERLDLLRQLASVRIECTPRSSGQVHQDLVSGDWGVLFSDTACLHDLAWLIEWARDLIWNNRDHAWYVVQKDQITGTPFRNVATELRACATCVADERALAADSRRRKTAATKARQKRDSTS